MRSCACTPVPTFALQHCACGGERADMRCLAHACVCLMHRRALHFVCSCLGRADLRCVVNDGVVVQDRCACAAAQAHQLQPAPMPPHVARTSAARLAPRRMCRRQEMLLKLLCALGCCVSRERANARTCDGRRSSVQLRVGEVGERCVLDRAHDDGRQPANVAAAIDTALVTLEACKNARANITDQTPAH